MNKFNNFLFSILLLIGCQISFAQETKKPLIKSGIRVSNENRAFFQKPSKYFYYQKDKEGNNVFSVNQGMNGDITMISATEYDSLNRETKSYWVHSNLGYYLSEMEYETNRVLHYSYNSDNKEEFSYDRKSLKNITTQEEFINLPVFENLRNAKRQLTSIEVLDSNGNLVKDIRLKKEGDTSSWTVNQYNDLKQRVLFKYVTPGSSNWNWDIHFEYDENGNNIKDYRVTGKGEHVDTTEIRNRIYNENNDLVLENYYNGARFQNKTEYFYSADNKLIKEIFYEGDEFKIDVETFYYFNKYGYLKKEVSKDYRTRKKFEKEVIKSRYKY